MNNLNKKKVLFVCKGHKNIAGAQRYLQCVAPCFPDESYELHYAYYFKDGSKVFEEIAKKRFIKTWEYDWRHLPFLQSLNKSLQLYKKLKPDILIFNSSENQILAPIIAAFFRRINKKVMVVHWATNEDSLPLITRKGPFGLPLPSRYAILTRFNKMLTYMMLTNLIFVNNITRKAYCRLFFVNPTKCRTIYNGLDPTNYQSTVDERWEMRKKLNVSKNEIMLLTTGNLTSVKGHSVLIKAIAQLIKKSLPVKCFIAGQGELHGELEHLIKKENLQPYCELLGYRSDVRQLLSATDIFVMPSLNEALSYSIQEALAAGKPVVASNVGGIPEVITAGKEGLLVVPGNVSELCAALSKLCDDTALRLKMGENGVKKIINTFTEKDMVNKTADFFKV
jgi:glycosyltransferase involved in cell wall biosynthesis